MSGILIYAVAVVVGVLVLIGLGVFCARTFALQSTLRKTEADLEEARKAFRDQNVLAQQIMESQRDELHVVNKHLEESLDGSLDESPVEESELTKVFGDALAKREKEKEEERKAQLFLDIFYDSSHPDWFTGFDEERLLKTAASLGCPISKEDAQRICRDAQWEESQLKRLYSGIVFRCRQMGEPYYIGTNGFYALKVTAPNMPEEHIEALVYEIFENTLYLDPEGTTEEELRRLHRVARKAIDELKEPGLEFEGLTIEFAEGQVSVAGQFEFPEWTRPFVRKTHED